MWFSRFELTNWKKTRQTSLFFLLLLQKKMFCKEAPAHMLVTTEAQSILVDYAAMRPLDFTWFLFRTFMGKHVDWIAHVILLPRHISNMSNRRHQGPNTPEMIL